MRHELAAKVVTESLEPPPSTMVGATNELTLSTTSLFDFSDASAADNGKTPPKFNMLSYNKYARPVGPTIKVKRKSTLKIHLKNDLVGPDVSPMVTNSPRAEFIHDLSTTNLHTHGLHVTPTDKSKTVFGDNIFREVAPGKDANYEYEIREDHPAGTFWYHPHKHGSVGYQLANGLAGALIVEGEPSNPRDLESIKAIRDAKDRILLLQWYTYSIYTPDPAKPLETVGFIDARSKGTYNMNADPNLTSAVDLKIPPPTTTLDTNPAVLTLGINGQFNPIYRMKPGEVERWRFIHAGWDQLQQLSWVTVDSAGKAVPTNDVKFYEIAVDGLATGKRTLLPNLEIAPGQRSDVLVKVSETVPKSPSTTYFLMRASNFTTLGTGDFSADPIYIASLVVEGDVHSMDLPNPTALAACRRFKSVEDSELTDATIPPGLGESRNGKTLTFRANDPAAPPIFSDAYYTVNDKTFEAHKKNPIELKLNTAQEWIIKAGSASIPATAPNTLNVADSSHPFHIHVNPFQVIEFIDLSGQHWPMDVWRDTLFVPAGTSYRIRMRFKDYTGYSVLHCHILDHEDQGMMVPIKIVDPNAPPLPPPPWLSTEHAKPSPRAVEDRQRLSSFAIPAPSLNLPDLYGSRHDLAKLRGKRVVLVFFAGIQCAHCTKKLRELVAQARQQLGDDSAIVAVSARKIADPRRAAEWLGQAEDDRFRLLLDEDHRCFREFGCMVGDATRHGLFVVDAKGLIRQGYVGDAPFEETPSVIKAVQALDRSHDRVLGGGK